MVKCYQQSVSSDSDEEQSGSATGSSSESDNSGKDSDNDEKSEKSAKDEKSDKEDSSEDNNTSKNGSKALSGSDSESGSDASGTGSVEASGQSSVEESGDDGSNSGSDKPSGSDDEQKDDSSASEEEENSENSSASSSNSKYWEENPDIYGIRRSQRERKQPDRINTEVQERNRKKAKVARAWNSSDSNLSEDSDSDVKPQRRRPPPKKVQNKRKRRGYSSEEEIKRSVRETDSKVSYKEESDKTDEEDLIEVDLSKEKEEDPNVQTVEKVIGTRMGKKGAVGMQTYIYEVEESGDPNEGFDPKDPDAEKQFLIKWKGWAHLHNTWESIESLKTDKVKGFKKVENFIRKDDDLKHWMSLSTPEEIEYMEIQTELESNLYQSHLIAERIFAEAEENDHLYYYIKWQNLPYIEATWELADITESRYGKKLEEYKEREASTCFPKQCPALKHRPKFNPLKEQSEFFGGDNEDLQLRDYQLDGLNWLVHAWCKHNSVILADEMGLGKTIQAICFLSYLFHTHHLYGPFLLVVPLSTLNAWQKEFVQWAPDINVITYIGDRDSRNLIVKYEFTFKSGRTKFNALLTTYEILLRDKDILAETCTWAALLIDEAHRLKNEISQLYQFLMEFKTNHRVLITGTPLQNTLKELWALLHFIMPHKFDDWDEFESQHDIDGNMPKVFQKLHKQLEPYLLRRVKKDVEKSLPSKVEKILRVDMGTLQKQYYKWILTKNYDALRKGNKGSTSSFVNIVMELKKCCNHAFLTRRDENYMQSQAESLQLLLKGSGKLLLLDKLLIRLNETGHRVLIFSQMVRMLDILAQYLELRRFTFQRLDGSINGELRRQALEHFNAENSVDFCFLLSTRAGGLGINLATADTVIIFDSDWNPQNDLQAQARAHRIGQKNQVNIYRLVTKNSIEETIIERAKKKMVLDHLVIQSMDTSGRTILKKKLPNASATPFDKDELNAILKFGAEELFKDDEVNEEEPSCDIDDILQRAETRDEGPSSVGDDLLSAFKVASFNLDEEEETSKVGSANDESTKDWDDIIPDSVRAQHAEEVREKEMAELYLAPRKRKKVIEGGELDLSPSPKKVKGEAGENEWSPSSNKGKRGETPSTSNDDTDDERHRPKRGRPRTHHKDEVVGFTDKEVRRFIKSFKKFANPLRRINAIAIDADIQEKTPEELKKLGVRLIEQCQECMKEYEQSKQENGLPNVGKGRRDRGPSFKLSGVSINAKTTYGILEELAPLDRIVPHAPVERASWVLQLKRVKDAHWDVPWGMQDDSRLLRGVYEYGMGSWEQLKGDPALNLGEKILLEGDAKPQAKHLENRVQYLLKLIGKTQNLLPSKSRAPKSKAAKKSTVKEPKAISKEIIENDDSTDEESTTLSHTSSVTKKHAKDTKKEKDTDVKEKDIATKTEDMDTTPTSPKEDGEIREEKSTKKKKRDKSSVQGPVHITANGKPIPLEPDRELDQTHPQWPECKEKMRPLKKALKALDNPNKSASQEEQIQHTRKCLIAIGDHIEKALNQHKDSEEHKLWKNLLWQFVSKFTEYDAKKLHKLYKKHKKITDDKDDATPAKDETPEKKKEHHHHHHHHHKDKHKEKGKKDEKDKPKIGDKEKHKEKDKEKHHEKNVEKEKGKEKHADRDKEKEKHKEKDREKHRNRDDRHRDKRKDDEDDRYGKRRKDDDGYDQKKYNGWNNERPREDSRWSSEHDNWDRRDNRKYKGGGGYNRGGWYPGKNRESHYPQDFQRDSPGGYHGDRGGYKSRSYRNNRGHDWRGNRGYGGRGGMASAPYPPAGPLPGPGPPTGHYPPHVPPPQYDVHGPPPTIPPPQTYGQHRQEVSAGPVRPSNWADGRSDPRTERHDPRQERPYQGS